MAHEMFLSEDFHDHADNIYEAILAIARRARQIGEEHRKEMDAYLSQVEMLEKFQEDEDNFDEPAKYRDPVLQFEKPTVLSLREMIADKLEIVRDEEAEKDRFDFQSLAISSLKLDMEAEAENGEGDSDAPTSFPSKLSLTDED